MTGLTALQLTVYVPLLDDEGTLNKGVEGVDGATVTTVVAPADQELQLLSALQDRAEYV
ncbi:hypothetical protein N9L66_05140 [Porticoccaceae bacterium]|nr:hypothetical protein [Porticoccaceae bacterium]